MHTHLQEKRQNERHFATETSASVMGFSLWSGRLLYEHEIYQKFLKHAKSIWQIFYSGYCVWPLVRLSLTHWLITWFHLIYKISKSSCILPYQWLQILPCNIKRKKKKKKVILKASKSFSSKYPEQIPLKRQVQGIYIKSFSEVNLKVKVQGCVRTRTQTYAGIPLGKDRKRFNKLGTCVQIPVILYYTKYHHDKMSVGKPRRVEMKRTATPVTTDTRYICIYIVHISYNRLVFSVFTHGSLGKGNMGIPIGRGMWLCRGGFVIVCECVWS